MIYFSAAPSPPLREFVARWWQCADSPAHRREMILPSGTFELVVNLCEDEIRVYDPHDPDRYTRYSGAVVSGPYRTFFLIDPQQHASIVGVHFKPGGAFPFFGLPAGEFAHAHVDLAALWGRAAVEMRERLCAAANATERFAILEAVFASRLAHHAKRRREIAVALEYMGRTRGEVSVRDMARRLNLSPRRFIELFEIEVGLTPKLFCRIQRFENAREVVSPCRAADWAHVAAACGYFDQSHLIRDFKAFAGLPPTAYLRRAGDEVLPHHVAQHA